MRNPRILFEDEVFVPVSSTGQQQHSGGQRSNSVSPVRSPQHNFNINNTSTYTGAGQEEGVRMRHPTTTKTVSTTYDVFFDQHLQNLSTQEMEEFFQWSTVTTKDPDTFEYYPDVNSEAFWMPYRWGGGSYLATT